MSISTASTGTQTATISTEHTLFDSSAAGTYLLTVDANAMTGTTPDVLELRVYKMVLTSGTRRVAYLASWSGAQDGSTDDLAPIKLAVPISTALSDSGAVRFTLKQTAGTGRAFPWTVEKV